MAPRGTMPCSVLGIACARAPSPMIFSAALRVLATQGAQHTPAQGVAAAPLIILELIIQLLPDLI